MRAVTASGVHVKEVTVDPETGKISVSIANDEQPRTEDLRSLI